MRPIDASNRPHRGFFGELFDLSFRDFITPRIIRVVYVLAIVLAALWCLTLVFGGFGTIAAASQFSGFGVGPNGTLIFFGIVEIVAAPVAFIVLSISIRVYLEFAMAVFRIADNTDAMRERQI